MKKIAFVIATKDRPKDVRKLLQNLLEQSVRPDQVVIVDASAEVDKNLVADFPALNIRYIYHPQPSASAQRNAGIKAVGGDIDLIGFLDDDVILEQGAMEAMLKFWESAPEDVGGCGFNLKNFKPTGMEHLKHSWIARWLGIYSSEKGVVMPSGWQTMIGEVSETTFVRWMPIGASLWRKTMFEKFYFDEFFDGYSYLEDLDFSYSVSRRYRLAVVSDAGYYHFPWQSSRLDPYIFGKIEATNRLYFVKKHADLSAPRAYISVLLRGLMSICLGIVHRENDFLRRALGNVAGVFSCLKSKYGISKKDFNVSDNKMKFARTQNIVILASAIGQKNRGIGQYERHLLPHLLELLTARGHKVSLILSRDALLPAQTEGVKYIKLPNSRDKSLLRFIAEQLYVPFACLKADMFLSLESVFPLVPFKAKHKIVVMHDVHVIRHSLEPDKYPEDYTRQYVIWANVATKKSVKSSDRIIAVSQFSGDEVHDVFGVPRDKIFVVHNGVDHDRFHPITDVLEIERVRTRYSLPSSFYLFIGPYSAKKNLKLIVETYASGSLPKAVCLPVVVAGDMRRSSLYAATLEKIKLTMNQDMFHFLGVVGDEDLPALYSAAKAFIYPSLYEGFGLPPLEAMACGVPVIASNTSSLPEVVGNAALLIDPAKPDSLVEALMKINDESVRQHLIGRGFIRAKEFSWGKTADDMMKAIFC